MYNSFTSITKFSLTSLIYMTDLRMSRVPKRTLYEVAGLGTFFDDNSNGLIPLVHLSKQKQIDGEEEFEFSECTCSQSYSFGACREWICMWMVFEGVSLKTLICVAEENHSNTNARTQAGKKE